jgi:hypothetical protein
MEPRADNLHINQKKQIRSFSTDRGELRKLLEILQERAYAAADIEERHLPKLEGQTDEQYEQTKKDLRAGFRFFVTLSGTDGRKLSGTIEDVFDSPNFPENVKDLFFDSTSPLRTRYNYHPRNKIILFIDFGRPEILNFTILPSQETRNESNIEVSGNDVTWVNGVFQEVVDYISKHPAAASWLHRHTVYDIIVWILGLPLSFWACSMLSNIIETSLSGHSPFLRAALYVYVFFITLILLRVAFHYARWIWPLTEYRSSKNRSLKHKAVFVAICSSMGLSLLYDVLKWLVK